MWMRTRSRIGARGGPDEEDAVAKKLLIFLAVASFLVPLTCTARVTQFVVTQSRIFAGGMSYGSAGSYERLDGTAYFEVDPMDPLNAVIVNLDKAPKNARGMVEFSSPFFVLKPVDMTRGNHKIWYGINNRGNKLEISLRSFPYVTGGNANNPLAAADVGNNLLLQLGYTIVDAGWEGDVIDLNNQLVPNLPVAAHPDGSPIVAHVRIEYSDRTIPSTGTFTLTLEGSPGFHSWEAADTNTGHATLTVRDSVGGSKIPIPSDHWAFGQCPGGRGTLVPTTTDICLFDGFQAEMLYELIYPAKNPKVMGLGYAVTRDVASFLRYQTKDDLGNPNPLALHPEEVGISRVYSSGTSQVSWYLREFVFLGFNEDEAHRKVFDGVTMFTAGGSQRDGVNIEFADPNTYSLQESRHDFFATAWAPLSFGVATDPISGVRGGILTRPATDPLVFQVDESTTFWNWRASLVVTDGLGNPVEVPDNVRLYFVSSFEHVGATGLFSPPGPQGRCVNLTHQEILSAPPTVRAFTIAMDEWADQGIEPPKSNYPRVENKTLITLDEYREAFPSIPGVETPTVLNELEALNFGPEFNSAGGKLTILPPVRGPSYKVLIPKPDEDGQDIAGIRPMEIRAPIGTNTGWNIRAPGFRAPELCSLLGSFIPFANTRAERLANSDPRKSLEERYKNHEGFVDSVEQAAKELVRARFLLPEDANAYVRAAQTSNVLQ